MSKKERLNYKYNNFRDDIINNLNLRIYYYERKKINCKDYNKILTNYRFKDDIKLT